MDFSSLKGKDVFICGFGKNCGKTTFLNFLLSNVNGKRACFSIGVDGEKKDSFSKIPKPAIKLMAGDMFLYNREFSSPAISSKIIGSYENGRIIAAEAMRGGFVEICGPSGNQKIQEIAGDFRQAGADTVIIDGAIDRITQAQTISEATLFYVCKVCPDNLEEICLKLKLLVAMSKTKLFKDDLVFLANGEMKKNLEGENLYLPNALTADKLENIPKQVKNIVLSDMTKVFLSLRQWEKLNLSKKVFFASRINLEAFVVNLYNVSKSEFESQAGKEVLKKTIYNPYEHTFICRN